MDFFLKTFLVTSCFYVQKKSYCEVCGTIERNFLELLTIFTFFFYSASENGFIASFYVRKFVNISTSGGTFFELYFVSDSYGDLWMG
jgi:hypothetical protein